jgi:hypothetical protein
MSDEENPFLDLVTVYRGLEVVSRWVQLHLREVSKHSQKN